KQPWFISPKDSQPIYSARITAWQLGRDVLAETGFAVITDAAGGMVDIHDRHPITLTPEDARIWLSKETSVKDALDLLSTPRPESAFQCGRGREPLGIVNTNCRIRQSRLFTSVPAIYARQ